MAALETQGLLLHNRPWISNLCTSCWTHCLSSLDSSLQHMCRACMKLALSVDTKHECRVKQFLSTEEDLDSTSMDELLLEANEMFELSQTISPDSYALLPTAPSSVDSSTLTITGTSSTQLESVK